MGEGGRVPVPLGLLLRRYARGTFPRGRVEALGLEPLGALQRGREDGGSMVEDPRGKWPWKGGACLTAALGSPANSSHLQMLRDLPGTRVRVKYGNEVLVRD